jgi:hypothetical protein
MSNNTGQVSINGELGVSSPLLTQLGRLPHFSNNEASSKEVSRSEVAVNKACNDNAEVTEIDSEDSEYDSGNEDPLWSATCDWSKEALNPQPVTRAAEEGFQTGLNDNVEASLQGRSSQPTSHPVVIPVSPLLISQNSNTSSESDYYTTSEESAKSEYEQDEIDSHVNAIARAVYFSSDSEHSEAGDLRSTVTHVAIDLQSVARYDDIQDSQYAQVFAQLGLVRCVLTAICSLDDDPEDCTVALTDTLDRHNHEVFLQIERSGEPFPEIIYSKKRW